MKVGLNHDECYPPFTGLQPASHITLIQPRFGRETSLTWSVQNEIYGKNAQLHTMLKQ